VAELSKLNLEHLDLESTSITGDAVKYILKIKGLKHLSLVGTDLNDEDLKQLAKLKNLQRLDISECSRMTEPGIDAFRKLLPKCKVVTGTDEQP
jgi:hypothetical protein